MVDQFSSDKNVRDSDDKKASEKHQKNYSENNSYGKIETNYNDPKKNKQRKAKSILLALVPFVLLISMIYFLSSPFGQNLVTKGIPVPELSIEKIEFHDNQIVVFIRNTGHEQIIVSQADVNDRIQSAAIEPSQILPRFAEAKVLIPFPWNPGEPYEIGITTSDGIRFNKAIDIAESTPIPNMNQISIYAMLGAFVGVIPILIGLSWYPFMRKISNNQYIFFLSLTVGLLIFLGIDALIESNNIATSKLASTFNGQMLIAVISLITFLGLYFFSKNFSRKTETKSISKSSLSISSYFSAKGENIKQNEYPVNLDKKGLSDYSISSKLTSNERMDQSKQQIIQSMAVSLMISIGIGLHNFGEGLAIGAAVILGESALSTFLIIGFTLHNTTEGLAIVAPLAKTGKLAIKRLLLMGLIAGIPTILGTWVGGFIYSPLASIIFLAVGAGAIFQVVYTIALWIKQTYKNLLYPTSSNPKEHDITRLYASIICGIMTGLLLMYLTGLLL